MTARALPSRADADPAAPRDRTGANAGGPTRPPGRRPAIAAAASAMRTRARAALWRKVLWDGALHDSASKQGAPRGRTGDTDPGREP
ncbi:hypothetical protein [Glycomyces terrestris]|uniref:Uncharacterized protein n=1 Tax=Glycomyces terrestris TaxID=2493553 RepID=A0A426USL3_9ACTN|nr:hypothetical protein [Glycomyces terrestris]RRR96122.1 hypothetical protein EIW28_22950 [Glycomyces terrestris]